MRGRVSVRIPATSIHFLIEQAKESLQTARPIERLTVSEWADRYRYLSPEASAEPGKWHTERAEYMRGVMDAFSDPTITSVVIMSSSQVGKTEVINNIVGYHVHLDPCPILVLQPTLDIAKTWSKDRLAPMLRDTPVLRGRVSDPKRGDTQNTVLHKIFPGGHITITGSNSPASLSSRPIRMVLCDEIDRYEATAGTEGDPIRLAEKRTLAFWNRKRCKVSTPTLMGNSRIEKEYERSDQRRFFVPCPSCGEYQTLKWDQVKYDEAAVHNAAYQCEHCDYLLSDWQRMEAVRRGHWRATSGDGKGMAGFHISELYSPFVLLEEIVADYLNARNDPAQYQVWVNTTLGETYDDSGDPLIHDATLYGRREEYGATVPLQGLLLTAGVDVQDDRLEIEVVAWGEQEESWSIAYDVLHGNTGHIDVWKQLDEYLLKSWQHETGALLRIACVCVDSGYQTQAVYQFVSGRQSRNIFAVKGASYTGRPVVSKPSRVFQARVMLHVVGTDTAKQVIYSRLKLDGTSTAKDKVNVYAPLTEREVSIRPGYMHFPMSHDDEYFKQLTGEKIEIVKAGGYTRRKFVPRRDRQEALDCRVYAYAALKILQRRDYKFSWKRLAKGIAVSAAKRRESSQAAPAEAAAVVEVEQQQAAPAEQQQTANSRTRASGASRPTRSRSGWVKGWRR